MENAYLCGFQAKLLTPFAVLGIRAREEWLEGIEYLPRGAALLSPQNRLAARACRQIEKYLDDPDYRFDIPVCMHGTLYQRQVWAAISRIPPGRTRTYSDIARLLGSGARAIGGACGANRLPLIIPCHRVVATQGLGGFMRARAGSALEIKRWLLRHEQS